MQNNIRQSSSSSSSIARRLPGLNYVLINGLAVSSITLTTFAKLHLCELPESLQRRTMTSNISSQFFYTHSTIPSSKPRFKSRATKLPRMSLPPRKPDDPNPSVSLLTTLTKLVWGQSLPPGLLVSAARSAWSSAWLLMMSQLAPSTSSGSYSRPTSRFRLDGAEAAALPSSSLHLYVGLPCPWAHRTLIVRALKGLEDAVPVSVAAPGSDGSWEFGTAKRRVADGEVIGPTDDRCNRLRNLREVYGSRRGGYSGRCTVPMLWDAERQDVACNESYDIICFFNSGMNQVARNPGLDLCPPELKPQIEEWNRVIYPNINNGVYRCGFAQSQEAYDSAVDGLFTTLDTIEDHLSRSRYLCGDKLTLADVCLFTTLIRFDIAYNVLFKCTKKKLVEYPNLHAYTRDIYQIPKVTATCNFPAIMDGYYKTLFPLNPSNIRPAMPSASEHETLSKPHDRENLVSGNLIAAA